jgi:DNA-binding transcriptional ArsR family regulator
MAHVQQPVQSGFSRIAEALSDPAREAIVSALSDGKAMPAGELARAAGVSPQSASAHRQKLVDARVLSVWSQGRFRYYRIVDDDVASLIESLIDLAVRAEKVDRTRARLPAPLRQSRTCYRHLAGQLGVSLSNALISGKSGCCQRSDRARHGKGHCMVPIRADRLQTDARAACASLQRLDRARSSSRGSLSQRHPGAFD